MRILSYCYKRFSQYPHNSITINYTVGEGLAPPVTIAFRNIPTTEGRAVYRRNGLAKTLGAQVIIDFRVAVSRESREERALGLSPLLFFFGYFLKMQKVTKMLT